ncbi:MAG: hypothetical protein E6R06_21395 [Mycobacterium sp.]|nr:MAG: hypothetical protein E6R06_21395 [Mycobacterium sp.]
MKLNDLDDSLYNRIVAVIQPGDVVYTLSIKRPNRIAGIERAGIWVETERSRKRRADPQLVPAWMVTAAWDHLCRNRVLTQDQLLNQLNVKRSAFVIALLALFPDVVVLDTRPTTLELAGD